jgi:hypothetical protein
MQHNGDGSLKSWDYFVVVVKDTADVFQNT